MMLLDIYPCRKDARRMERGRRADQAQRRDGGLVVLHCELELESF